jgi:hypothetical protein
VREVIATREVTVICVCALLVTACTTSSPPSNRRTPAPGGTGVGRQRIVGGLVLQAAPAIVAQQCAKTANALGYPVPCPRLLPRDVLPTPIAGPFANSKKAHEFIHTGYGSFRKFVTEDMSFPAAGTSLDVPNTGYGHLVISGAPQGMDLRHLLYGPSARSNDPVKPEGFEKVFGVRGEFVRVLPTDSNSIFQFHLVLTWSSGDHLYAVGFHRWNEASRALDLAVARSIVLVSPAS